MATALCAASRLGYRCAFAGVVGDDSDGREVWLACRPRGIDTTATTVLPQIATRSALILVDERGDRIVFEHRHPSLLPPPTSHRPRCWARPASCTSMRRFRRSAAGLREGRAARALTSLDLDRDTPDAVALLPEADLAIVAANIPCASPDWPRSNQPPCALARTPPGLLIVTLGEAGSLLALPDGAAVICHRQSASWRWRCRTS